MSQSTEYFCCAMLTPPGRGAVAVIGVLGLDSGRLLEPLFASASGKRLDQAKQQSIFYGHWVSSGEDVVIVRTGENRFEVHCHGGQAAPALILESLKSIGCHEIARESAAAIMMHGRWAAEVATALADSMTETTAKILLRQSACVETKLKQLLELTDSDVGSAIKSIESMIGWAELGRHLTQPRSVVLCGRPNVGKSSLINAIVGFNRAIVHETPGTTRDIVSQRTAIEGWPIELKDTAGLRSTESVIEKKGIEFSEAEIRKADLVVAIFDATEEFSAADREFLETIKPGLIVFNKLDLAESERLESARTEAVAYANSGFLTSTKTKLGIAELITAIGEKLTPQNLPDNVLIPVSSGQLEELRRWLDSLTAGDVNAVRQAVRAWI